MKKLPVIGKAAAIVAAVGSAKKAYDAHKEISAFDREYIEPLRKEKTRWDSAKGALNGAIDELSYHERPKIPSRYDLGSGERLEFKVEEGYAAKNLSDETHIPPNPKEAYDLVSRVKGYLENSGNKKKESVIKKTGNVKLRLNLINSGRARKPESYDPLRQDIAKIVLETNKVINDYQSRIFKLENERDYRREKWVGVSAASLLLALTIGNKKK